MAHVMEHPSHTQTWSLRLKEQQPSWSTKAPSWDLPSFLGAAPAFGLVTPTSWAESLPSPNSPALCCWPLPCIHSQASLWALTDSPWSSKTPSTSRDRSWTSLDYKTTSFVDRKFFAGCEQQEKERVPLNCALAGNPRRARIRSLSLRRAGLSVQAQSPAQLCERGRRRHRQPYPPAVCQLQSRPAVQNGSVPRTHTHRKAERCSLQSPHSSWQPAGLACCLLLPPRRNRTLQLPAQWGGGRGRGSPPAFLRRVLPVLPALFWGTALSQSHQKNVSWSPQCETCTSAGQTAQTSAMQKSSKMCSNPPVKLSPALCCNTHTSLTQSQVLISESWALPAVLVSQLQEDPRAVHCP